MPVICCPALSGSYEGSHQLLRPDNRSCNLTIKGRRCQVFFLDTFFFSLTSYFS
ncbi:hypothetical protein HMPREF1548_04465 [Clostridium sp. KLE 1755]|nr:hypothetical protein HMPREF1548_04465 [Clostridium sp. KLE 1755]